MNCRGRQRASCRELGQVCPEVLSFQRAGVTLLAVATSLGILIRSGRVRAEGDLDFRGTLGVDREAPVGFGAIRLLFELETLAGEQQLRTLQRLTERYCVGYQTLNGSPALSTTVTTQP